MSIHNNMKTPFHRSSIMRILVLALVCFASCRSFTVFPKTMVISATTKNLSSIASYSSKSNNIDTDAILTTKSTVLDDLSSLSTDERSVANVFRQYGPSVAYVTSFAERTARRNRNKSQTSPSFKKSNPPTGSVSLGSGSSFCISDDGYFLTNYHVIQRAYQIHENQEQMAQLFANITNATSQILPPFLTLPSNITPKMKPRYSSQVYLRLPNSSSSKLIPARIVTVKPEQDLAILHLNVTNNNTDDPILLPKPIPLAKDTFNLLVGQNVLAIGNPFGLDQTLTSGIISALDRTVQGVAGNTIQGCIQTDASINPGNSGGPLLDSKGNVIGMNTMIITTSGSSAGIGFAVPLNVRQLDRILAEDRRYTSSSRRMTRKGWLGLEVLDDDAWIKSLSARVNRTIVQESEKISGVFVKKVVKNSPADAAGIRSIQVKEGQVETGDRIVAINGSFVETPSDVIDNILSRVVGEQISLTLEDEKGIRRVVYVSLGEKNT